MCKRNKKQLWQSLRGWYMHNRVHLCHDYVEVPYLPNNKSVSLNVVLTIFYASHNLERMMNVDNMLTAFAGKRDRKKMHMLIKDKYGIDARDYYALWVKECRGNHQIRKPGPFIFSCTTSTNPGVSSSHHVGISSSSISILCHYTHSHLLLCLDGLLIFFFRQ